jgi:hypothetical protein
MATMLLHALNSPCPKPRLNKANSIHVQPKPCLLLRPSLFSRDGFLHWKGHGLVGAARVGDADRKAACPNVGETFDDIDDFLQRFETRKPTKIEINPVRFPLHRLRDWLAEAKRFKASGETISVTYGLPKNSYDYSVSDEMIDGQRTLSQHLALIAFDARDPVGYSGMTYSVMGLRRDRHARLRIELHLAYVDPRRRGEGYGLDLSVATGWAARELLCAFYSGVRSGMQISCSLEGDFESEGGEAFYNHVFDELQVERDFLLEVGRRRVDIEEIAYEAGW